MAVAKSEYLIEIKLIDGKAQATLNGVSVSLKDVDKQLKNITKSSKATTVATKQLTEAQKKQVDKSGLAGATLVELGRTISDLPFGITAITNNLSQLSTLFITLIASTGGAKDAFEILGKQIRGPLGLILGFQVLITALDFFAKSSAKAKREAKELGDEFAVTNRKVLALTESLGDAELAAMKALGFRPAGGTLDQLKELTGDELQKAIKRLSSEFPTFSKMLKNVTDPSETGLNQLIKDFFRLSELGSEIDKAYKAVGEATNPITKQFASSQLNLLIDERIAIQEKYVKETNNQNGRIKPFELPFELDNEIYAEMVLGMTQTQVLARDMLIESGKDSLKEFNNFAKQFLQDQRDIADAQYIVEQFKIDTAYRTVDSIRSISSILDSLAGENKALMVGAIIAEKASAIGEMIISTTKSNRAIKAAGAAAIALNPAAAAATAAATKKLLLANKIGLGIDIAAVVAQAASAISQIGGPSGGTGGGGGANIQAPDFNVVGASQTSQLATTVAGQQAKPVRAFVVGKDISTQQELDRNISNTASFG